MKPKYIFVAGGVMSGVGKGVAAASIAKILSARGFRVTSLKIDPYVNVDAGTMNPTEHGEVFVLDDGMECDQDMGNYERFLNVNLSRANYMTTGSVYRSVIERERNLEYGGKCVEVVPHIPLEVIRRIENAIKINKAEIAITEIGGTVGEYQNILFLEAVRMLKIKHPQDVALVLVSYLPILANTGELKSKPTQYAARSLNAAGLQPDIILARAKAPLDDKRKETIAMNCSVQRDDIISAPDVESIYEVPINFEKGDLSGRILKKLSLRARGRDLADWRKMAGRIRSAKETVRIGIVGKYFASGDFTLADSYISVIEAVKHGAVAAAKRPAIEWLDAEEFEKNPGRIAALEGYDGVIIPGGFGSRGVEGKINVIQRVRERGIPYIGLCYGMQLAVVEYARNVAGLAGAHTTEVNPETKHPVIDILPEQKEKMKKKDYGATMRLGAYPAKLKPGTVAAEAYRARGSYRASVAKGAAGAKSAAMISERHRHRFEVNPEYIETLEKRGLVFSGISPDRRLMEIAELPASAHPFFLGTQFHPELKSRPLAPHPLFSAFVKAASVRAGKR